MEIKREYYIDKLIKRQSNGLIKVITGIDKEHIIRFAFNSADDLHLIWESLISVEKEKRSVNLELCMEYILSQISGERKYYLLLDEVQLLDCFESIYYFNGKPVIEK